MTSPADTADAATGVAAIWRDERLRGIAIQIGVILTFFACVFWLVGNVVANFTSLNKSFGFSFLWELPAGYDINQTLIPYNNADTHLRAAFVGLINTGVVAAIGIVLATIFGFVLGVLRLSNNWLASRVAYWYIEFTRNVPVLLHILLWHGIIINTLPHPRQALAIGDGAFLSNRGFYVPRPRQAGNRSRPVKTRTLAGPSKCRFERYGRICATQKSPFLTGVGLGLAR